MSNPLYRAYEAKKAELETATEAVKARQGEARDILRQILATAGKGPHDIGGKQCTIQDRAGTLVLMPARPKVTRKPKEKPASKKGSKTAQATV